MCREKNLFLNGLGIGLLAISSIAFAESNPSSTGNNPSNMESTSAPEFNKVDKDADGFITISEAKEVKGLPEIYGQVDANADGKLTQTEYSTAVKKQSVAP